MRERSVVTGIGNEFRRDDNEWGYTCRLADLAALVGAPFRQERY